ncbi:hypothetical protein EXN22_12430 [Pseudomonas tructae]|uniref:DUF6916 domain-containing protein n=1 Tax=Pseudomonas tructae TaxID=2518644 RepID=A0A411MIG7_9PSED|nr:hypothetical protein [Pseudomonas tructae]QBF26459.1 hypothetical protein EXN22_12430 [Pseudomonas tructae]
MNVAAQFPMPTFAQLQAADPYAFALWLGADNRVAIERVQLTQGVAMSARHECFLVFFALPAGLLPQQGVYRVIGPEQQEWLLLMTPVQPEPDGRHVLQAVLHREREPQP